MGRDPKPMTQLSRTDIHPEADFSFFDETDPRSLINLVPLDWVPIIKALPAKYFKLSEKVLEKELEPDAATCRLRIRFWDEYNEAQNAFTKINIRRVYYGVCGKETFKEVYLPDPTKLAWILRPPKDYMLSMHDILSKGLDVMREMVNLPIITREPIFNRGEPVLDKEGQLTHTVKYNNALMKNIIASVDILLNRVQGAVVQRIAIKQQNITAETKPLNIDDASLEDLEKLSSRLSGIASQIEKAKSEEVIDVESEDDDRPI